MTIKFLGKIRSLDRATAAVYTIATVAALVGADWYGHIMQLARIAQ
jgi:hypothetical protein